MPSYAYIVRGGNEQSREEKIQELRQEFHRTVRKIMLSPDDLEIAFVCAEHIGPNEKPVMHHTFDDVKRRAGDKELPIDLREHTEPDPQYPGSDNIRTKEGMWSGNITLPAADQA